MVSWSSTGTCVFKRTRRGIPFAAQTTASNAIRIVVNQEDMNTLKAEIKGMKGVHDRQLLRNKRVKNIINPHIVNIPSWSTLADSGVPLCGVKGVLGVLGGGFSDHERCMPQA
ncbi:hypothetical protein M9H77_09507 [Catharanthus roseus]|uniref:Uncharacterized protein n=1 Tax=Catharanthus roseus TaxID=4058 RepID=A0ACC0C0Z4_CATRO|nr:hypothetical protein M9H77_09507 [Catharanthus roseus]